MTTSQTTGREYAYFRITGPGTHEMITETLGLRPTEAGNVGDINERTGRPYRFMSWTLRSGLDDAFPMAQHIEFLFRSLRMKERELRELWVEYDISLQCVGHYPRSRDPGIHFNREVVRQAAQLGISIDCDLYFVEDLGHVA